MRTLVVTNDFPPRPGGIQAYVHGLAARQPAGEIVVYASSWEPGDVAGFDAAQPFPVVRDKASVLLPTPRVVRSVREVARSEGCDRVWFGAVAPLALMASQLDLTRALGSTMGHEIGWARLPGAASLLRRMSESLDVVTHLSHYTGVRLARSLPHAELVHLPSGVDTTAFHPSIDGEIVRRRYGLVSRPVVVCVSRVVARKGQDQLVRAFSLVQQRIPEAALLIVGGGPMLPKLKRQVESMGLERDVVLTGEVPWPELPLHYAAGDVFAMTCYDRVAGLEVEGLGIVFLEAAATGLPVVAGRSGGTSDTVQEGVTGYLVDGTSTAEVAARISALLADPQAARAMGAAGRRWMESEWQWDVLATRLRGLLAGT